MHALPFLFDDGGRSAAGFKGTAGDCVTRSVAIVSGLPYREVYGLMVSVNSKTTKRRTRSARSGIKTRSVHFKRLMKALGFVWTPTMHIGQGCKVHLLDGELPSGRLVVAVSKHYTAVLDGVIHDTFNPTRLTYLNDGRVVGRCVYGYWEQE